jgi:hypothetical protein
LSVVDRQVVPSEKRVKKLLVKGLLLLLVSGSALAADGPKEVEAAIQQGNYTLAEQDLRQAITEHPQSAKAHYLLAQVLAHEGNIGEAQKEASQAKAIDPKISFTDPAKFNHFQAELNQALAPSTGARRPAASAREVPYAAVEQPAAQPRSSGSIWPWVIGAVIVVLLFGWFRRRQQGVMYGNQGYGPQGYGAPGPQNPYGGNGPYPPPGYQPGPQGGSGIGGSILGGLAGGVLGAAAVNAYENHERREEEERGGDFVSGNGSNFAPADPQDQAYDQLRNQPIDMGNNDNSWDDSSSGGGSFDDSGDDSWS